MTTETIARGDLFFLWHPGTEFTFSGLGLAVEDGRKDLLVGLLMIDRPQPVPDVWLAHVEQTFGGYALYTMTAPHEHGLACVMRVEEASLPYVRPLDSPLIDELRQALTPFLEEQPEPRITVTWDPFRGLWTSWFAIREPTQRPLFPLGEIVATHGAIAALVTAGQSPVELLTRHMTGDWGDLVEEDRRENERALKHGSRLFSSYKLNDGTKLWIITEHDRSVTTLLLPSEY